jgi:AraC-like DNA-binding protein
MTSSSGPVRPRADDERAHLRDRAGFSPPVSRFAPAPEVADLVRRHWLPVWSLPPGRTTVQRALQFPVCLVVIAPGYATLVGPTTGLSTRELAGEGWAAGVMLQPAAGSLLLDGPVVPDTATDLATLTTLDGSALVAEVRGAMAPAPSDPDGQERAMRAVDAALAALLPVDEEGRLVNGVVEYVEGDARVQRVGQICDKFALTERSLQRLAARRIGLSPKWLIQRRRLHEAAERLSADGSVDLARVAADLGYTDQAHFGRDWRRVTGVTPGEYAAQPRLS